MKLANEMLAPGRWAARSAALRLLLGALLACTAACPGATGTDPEPDAGPDPDPEPEGDGGSQWPPAATNRTDPIGTGSTFDFATWNIEDFPKSEGTTAFIADLIRSMRLDLVGVQEIRDETAFEELVGRLPEHEGVLSPHTYGDGTYQKVGFVYRSDLIELRDVTTIFAGNWFAFPRPPLEAKVLLDDGDGEPTELRFITAHLKATNDPESIERRTQAFEVLDGYLDSLDEDVVLLGDFNEVLTNDFGQDVFGPFAEDDDAYTIHTESLAISGAATFLHSGAMLDHIIATASLDDELAGQFAVIPPLDDEFITYEGLASDHLPVAISMPIP